MPEKLLTVRETADFLGISEEDVRKLVEKGDLPAYRIGGQFLRFRKEQIEAIQREIPERPAKRPERPVVTGTMRHARGAAHLQSPVDAILDFFYFNDFYIVSIALTILILWFIFK